MTHQPLAGMMRFGFPHVAPAGLSPIMAGAVDNQIERQMEDVSRDLDHMVQRYHRYHAKGRRRASMRAHVVPTGVGGGVLASCHGDWNYLAPFSENRTLYTMVTEAARWRVRTQSRPTSAAAVSSRPTRSKRHGRLGRTGSRATRG